MIRGRFTTALTMAALLAACGGDDNGGGTITPPVAITPAPPPSSGDGCTVRERQDWASAQINEWYLFPETLPASLVPTQSTVGGHIDWLTATARAQGRDRYFTYLTSIAEENAFYSSGSTAGFGVRLSLDSTQQRLYIAEAYEGAPALAAGIDRGTEIVAIGTTASDLKTISAILAAGGPAAVTDALGPPTAGTTRLLRIADASGTRDVSVTKAEYDLTPVSSRYGARIIDDGGRRVGYLNLRTFIVSADPALREAFAQFRAAGINELVVDLRYNGGGLVSIANLMGDLLGGNRSTSDVFSHTAFRPEKASNDTTRRFAPQPESVGATRIAFIGTGSSASASEMVINGFIPYLKNAAALVGTDTYGKPVGQIAVDRAACDDRLRIVAFATKNSEGQGDYFDGLADKMHATCQATDDLARPLGDPAEASTRQALDFLAGRSCTAISTGATTLSVSDKKKPRELLVPERPSTVQREVPGSF